MDKSDTPTKYGIKSVLLNEYFPSFLADCHDSKIQWTQANSDIYGRIRTFLLWIAQIQYKKYLCYCCIYPCPSSAEYTVFIDIDNGRHCILLTTIRDSNLYPQSWTRVNMLRNDLFLLDTSQKELLTLRQEILYSLHLNE